MFRTIASSINYPRDWAGTAEKPSRWRRLDQLDRLLDGKFYEHLPYSFYEEQEPGTRAFIALEKRRPSSQYHLAAMVARWAARKMWAGRHVPRIHHSSEDVTSLVEQLVQTTKFFSTMLTASFLGSVGSVGLTFKIDTTQGEPQVGFRVWRAKECNPVFDDFGNLAALRVNYNVKGIDLLRRAIRFSSDGQPVRAEQEYWWVRDYTQVEEITYVPPRVEDYNPENGFRLPELQVIAPENGVVRHNLGFVPGVWIRNLGGSTCIDGWSTWEDAKDNAIEVDYLLSQASRGTRYNCAPELVIIGELEGDLTRSAATCIHLRGSVAEEGGTKYGEGKAELLEMSGEGVKVALEQIDKLRNMALEQIGATRKDPERVRGVMSGRAMEFLDEDSHDLVMELRAAYGDGALELFRKVLRALGKDAKGLRLDWPRLYQPTPEDLAHIIPALVLAATPIQEPLEPEEAAKIGGGAEGVTAGESVKQAQTTTNKAANGASKTVKTETTKGPAAQGGRPSVKPTGGKNIGSLLEVDEASRFLKMYMDIDLLPGSEDRGITDSDTPLPVPSPPERQEAAPEEGTGSAAAEPVLGDLGP